MAGRLHLDAVITPTRSLPLRGFLVLLGLVLGLDLLAGIAFVALGAAPILLFLGAGVLGLCLAFWASYRQARARERVQVTADHVMVTRERGLLKRTVWTSPTAFTRVALEKDKRQGAEVRLMISGRRLTIGSSLGPKEREGLAQSVEAAIRSARAERYDD
jgi:uncharacterized membrane protein